MASPVNHLVHLHGCHNLMLFNFYLTMPIELFIVISNTFIQLHPTSNLIQFRFR